MHLMTGVLDMKMWGLHVANTACDKVQSKGQIHSHFEADFLDELLDAS